MLTFTAVKLFRRAQMSCGLTVTWRSLTSLDTSSMGFGREKVNTSPIEVKAAKVVPQLVTLSIIGLIVDCAGLKGKDSARTRGVEKLST